MSSLRMTDISIRQINVIRFSNITSLVDTNIQSDFDRDQDVHDSFSLALMVEVKMNITHQSLHG